MTPDSHAQFPKTAWSIVVNAAENGSAEPNPALEKLCSFYWPPIYALLRRKGHPPHEAADLTQDFFVLFLSRDLLRKVHREKGRFRDFLRACLEHVLAKKWRAAHTQKAGGGSLPVSLDLETAEASYQMIPSTVDDPSRVFEWQWAMSILDQAMQALSRECEQEGKREVFAVVQSLIGGEPPDQSYAELAARLNTTPGALKVAVHRLRARYGELIRETVAQTLTHPGGLDAEISHLMAVLRG